MTVSLIISTYNWPRALELCLESVMRQRVMPTEIVIADDGSGPETRCVVEHFAKLSPVPLLHVWQEDNGFRLAAIRNKAIAASSGEYIVQIDGDAILQKNFIFDHMDLARKNFFVGGSRSRITEGLTPKVISGKIKMLGTFTKGIDCRKSTLRIPILRRFYKLTRSRRGVIGCNMAFWREDILKINGYDEKFTGWGGEDSDIQARMENLGIGMRLLRYGGILYHIHHKEAAKEETARNREMFKRNMIEKVTRCENGIDQYLTQAPFLYPDPDSQQ